jgi:hypothetical protein
LFSLKREWERQTIQRLDSSLRPAFVAIVVMLAATVLATRVVDSDVVYRSPRVDEAAKSIKHTQISRVSADRRTSTWSMCSSGGSVTAGLGGAWLGPKAAWTTNHRRVLWTKEVETQVFSSANYTAGTSFKKKLVRFWQIAQL